MSSNPIIKCDICGYEFKIYKKMETHYDDYMPCDEPMYYPLESENAHLIHNYICDKCYKSFSNIIRLSLIESGKEHLDGVKDELIKAEKKYLDELSKIRAEENSLKEVIDILEKTEVLLKLSDDVKKFINDGRVYLKGKYYFNDAMNWEKEQYLKQKPIRYWEEQFNVDVISYPDGVKMSDWVTADEYLDMLLDCKVEDMTSRDILNIIEQNKGGNDI